MHRRIWRVDRVAMHSLLEIWRPLMSKWTVAFAAALALLMGGGAERIVYAQDAVMVLDISGVTGQSQRPKVTFKHEMHSEMFPNCVECHHIYEYKDGVKTNVWDGEEQTCSECHGADKDGDKPSIRNAFHNTCVGCHRETKKRGEKAGPTSCGQCHIQPDSKLKN